MQLERMSTAFTMVVFILTISTMHIHAFQTNSFTSRTGPAKSALSIPSQLDISSLTSNSCRTIGRNYGRGNSHELRMAVDAEFEYSGDEIESSKRSCFASLVSDFALFCLGKSRNFMK